LEVFNLSEQKEKLEAIADVLQGKKEIDNNPFALLPKNALKEALKTIYEASEEFDT
jgi:hypothetical protein